MTKILVAIDGSDCALKAVEYSAAMFSTLESFFTLFHVLPYVPPEMWDIGHILSEKEQAERQTVIEKWFDSQKRQVEPLLQKAEDILLKAGVDPSRVESKIISDSTDVAESVIEEARNGRYSTLVLGRCGSSGGVREFLLGSTTSRIITRGAGLAISVVE